MAFGARTVADLRPRIAICGNSFLKEILQSFGSFAHPCWLCSLMSFLVFYGFSAVVWSFVVSVFGLSFVSDVQIWPKKIHDFFKLSKS